MHTFYQLGKNMHFHPFFSSPFNIISHPPGAGGSNRKINTPASFPIIIWYTFRRAATSISATPFDSHSALNLQVGSKRMRRQTKEGNITLYNRMFALDKERGIRKTHIRVHHIAQYYSRRHDKYVSVNNGMH